MSDPSEFSVGALQRKRAAGEAPVVPEPVPAGHQPGASGAPAAPPAGGMPLPFDPWRIVDALVRRWWLVVGAAMLGGIGMGALGYYKFKSVATVTAQLIRQDLPATFRSSEMGEPFKPRQINAQTLISLMKSPALLERVGSSASNKYTARALLAGLTVVPERNTDLIKVTFATTRGVADAISLINLYGHEVVHLTQELTAGEAGEINRLLKKEIARVDEDTARLKGEVANFSRQTQLLDPDKELDASLRKLMEFDLRAEAARIDYETADIRIKALEKELAQHNETAGRLQNARDALAKLADGYTTNNPIVLEQMDKVKKLEKELEESIGKPIQPPQGADQTVASSLYLDLFQQRSHKDVLAEQIAKMKATHDTLVDKLKGIPEQGMELATLKAKLAMLAGARALLTSRQREAQQFEDNNFGYYRFFDAKNEDVESSGRGKKIILAAVGGAIFLAGLLAGICGLRESLDDRVRTAADLRRATQLPLLGALPVLPAPPAVPLAWAVRLWTQLQPQLLADAGGGRWIAFAAVGRGEGLSTVAAAFAEAAARRDSRVVVVTDSPPAGPASIPLDRALEDPASVRPDHGETAWVAIPADWRWEGIRRRQWIAAMADWRARGLTGFLELPPIGEAESLLMVECVPQLVWVTAGGATTTGAVQEQFVLLRHTPCRLVGAILNREPRLVFGLGRVANVVSLVALAGLAFLAPGTVGAAGPAAAAGAVQPAAQSVAPPTAVAVPVAPKPPAPMVLAGSNAKVRAPWQERLVLGAGDTVNLHVYGHGELTRADVPVGPDGRISYLDAQGVVAAGRTIDELRAALNEELLKFRRNVRVIVTPSIWRSRRYYILGKVYVKGPFPLNQPTTVIEAIAQAGGLETGIFQQNTVELADLPRSFLVRRGQRVPVDFDRLFLHGDLSQNVLLEPEDYLYFPSSIANEVYILGSIGNPSSQGLTENASVVSVITLAGGFLPKAYRKHVLVVRGSLQTPQTFIVNVADILAGRAKDFVLEPRDIVYVADRPWARAEELLDMAAGSFIQGMMTSWSGANIGPFISNPILPSIK